MKDISELEKKARQIRKDIIEMSYECGRAAHPGPALSCTEVVTAIYFRFANIDVKNPLKEDRDRFILSKGHACPVLYAALVEKGFIERNEFKKLRHPDGLLQGHPSYKKTPGIDMTTGSLGNGLGLGLGMAYYLKNRGYQSRVYVVLGDGELNEGTVWEAIMYAPVIKMDNLIAFVDVNGFQSCGECESIIPQQNLEERWQSFGWNVISIDGNDMAQVVNAIELAQKSEGKPTVILARTVKGKGISFMENDNQWHQHVLSLEQYKTAMAELEEK